MQTRLALNARKTRGVGPLLCGSLKRTTRANHVATPQKTHIQTLHLNELINKRPRLVKWLEERPQAGAAVGQLIDDTYGLFMNQKLVTPFFDAGWGNLDVVDFKKDSDEMLASIETSPLLEIDWKLEFSGSYQDTVYDVFHGVFDTPVFGRVREWLPIESRTAHVRLIRPRHCANPDLTIHLAGTGDHGFMRRHLIALPLVADGVASVILESPYYGRRKPIRQVRSKLLHVCDLLVLGFTTIAESLHLLRWAKHNGYHRSCVSGFSMGGVHAAMVACLSPEPVACSPHLAPHSASEPFCNGPLWQGTRLYRTPRDFIRPVSFQSEHGRLDDVNVPYENELEATRLRLERAFSITDVTKFPKPLRPDAAVFVVGRYDRYVSLDSASRLQSHFDGSQIHIVDGGHVSSFLMYQDWFRSAVLASLSKL